MGIEYLLSRSKRKSIGITVSAGGVFVKAPIAVSVSAIEGFIVHKMDWIQRKTDLHAERQKIFSSINNFTRFYLHGKEYCGEYAVVRTVTFDGEKFFLPIKYQNDRVKLSRALIRFYTGYSREYLYRRLAVCADSNGISFKKFRLTNAKRKWGSCSSIQEISLNWRLVLLDDFIVDYVILHELCHTYHLNHGENFWRAVQTVCPDYKKRKAELKKMSAVIELYRIVREN